MKVGVLGFQGGVLEHIYILRRIFNEGIYSGEVSIVKKKHDFKNIDALIIPGGESTTIGILMEKMGLVGELRDRIMGGLPTMGICAGAVLMAKKVEDRVVCERKQPLLSVMDIKVIRNYFGRQIDSFEADIHISRIGGEPFRGIFIRAPAFEIMNGSAIPLANFNSVPVLVAQSHMLAVAFHPELTKDARVHKLFIEMAKR